MTKSQVRKERKRRRHRQKRINVKLKKRLFGHLSIAPCFYCKKVFLLENLTIEHIVPLCLGGTNDPSNIALACSPCNHERGRQAWFQRQEISKKYYEQYNQGNRIQDRASVIQEIIASFVYCQGNGV